MKLLVRVVEARNLRAMDFNGSSDPYVRLQLGRCKFKTRVVKKNLNPLWSEEFSFRLQDLEEELSVCVLDEDKYSNDDFLGQLQVPVCKVFEAEEKSLGVSWYALEPKSKRSKNKDCGEILLKIWVSQNNSFQNETPSCSGSLHMEQSSDVSNDSSSTSTDSTSRSSACSSLRSPSEPHFSTEGEELNPAQDERTNRFSRFFAQIFLKKCETPCNSSRGLAVPDLPIDPKSEIHDCMFEDSSSDSTFDEQMRILKSKEQGGEIPSTLPGGTLLNQSYVVTPPELNNLLFSPDSKFIKSLSEVQGTTEFQQGPWRFENGGEKMKRVTTYMTGATKLLKSVKATEEQTYLKADGSIFTILVSVSTPDVIYGSTFKTEMIYSITPGPELPSGEQSSRLVISWRVNFLQSTIMKGLIERGAQQGLKNNFEQFAAFLSQNVKQVDHKDLGSDKDQILASLQLELQSSWKLAAQYFLNFTVVFTAFLGLYIVAHIFLVMPSTIQGLEFDGIDLPDSIGEVIVSGILVLLCKRVLEMVVHFMLFHVQKGSDHQVKAQGNGWLLTVALIEGSSIATVDSTAFSDPYVVFTCNGKTRTSSIKFQKPDPRWNEIFEFDAMNEPPSMLDVEVFDFDGPFDEATSLGHTEINFVKSNLSNLADIWVPLQGKLAQPCQSKLHLRIFLTNTISNNIVENYLAKMEKEVGKKINLRSPQTNSAFQKLFGLPHEEFLINDFTCHLKRKMPLQGRLFLSARIIGFHTNLFGHKTTFFFLWEDIEDIQVLPPTLSSIGSPIIIIILRPGRGTDAKHGAKTQDEEGRLKFHFQSFVSYSVARRTILALWKARSMTPEQKLQIVEEESDEKCPRTEESGSFFSLEEASLSEVYSSVLPVPLSFFTELFSGGDIECKVMEKVGCLDYSHTPWELMKPDLYQRQICYKFDKQISCYGGEVTSTQQRSTFSDRKGWVVEEVMTIHGVPYGDYFTLHIRYQVEDLPKACNVQVFFGTVGLKSTRHRKRITRNMISSMSDRLKAKYSLIEKEFIAGK
ncbi:hypothetical protein GIB67_013476 [Kingdonia uniflora]|uniref:C2 and GRAM domain-containing protein n=1 Tax=Kingdonia uniflora TaxID=39325 RepID=A0A7J7LR49_9MAGN|nr:hypothetical protein GIB67_013476 [Kingdonia uniflora]